jgi:3',5'-cyclic AMP phosphodiesterase CpdA
LRARDLLGKRLTGFLNWHKARKHIHDMALLDRLVADIAEKSPGLILLGGDIANIGHPEEFIRARQFLARLSSIAPVVISPGNHDIYVGGSFEAMRAALGAWMRGDDGPEGAYPLLLRREEIGIVVLNSGSPSLPFYATGKLGAAQIAAARGLLERLAREGRFRLVLVHHAPHVGGSRIFRDLRDAPAFEAMLRETGADLVVHGHNHRTSLATRPGPSENIPIVGVGSASAAGGSVNHWASWHLLDIADGKARIVTRRADKNGAFADEPLAI